jgi:hypothetical protein
MQAQALGPLAEADRQRLEKLVADLQSENAAIRNEAERDRADDAQRAARASAALSEATARVDAAEAKLAAAYERERSLATSSAKRFGRPRLCVLAVVAGVACRDQTQPGRHALSRSHPCQVVTASKSSGRLRPTRFAQLETIPAAQRPCEQGFVRNAETYRRSPQASRKVAAWTRKRFKNHKVNRRCFPFNPMPREIFAMLSAADAKRAEAAVGRDCLQRSILPALHRSLPI